jgi:uncharacterized membrane protein YjjP (DUF1212 family)
LESFNIGRDWLLLKLYQGQKNERESSQHLVLDRVNTKMTAINNTGNFQPRIAGDTESFLLICAKALHESGLPAHRLERMLEIASLKMGLKADFFISPGSVFASFNVGSQIVTHLKKVGEASLHLEKIDRIESLLSDVSNSKTSIESGIQQLENIQISATNYNGWVTTLFFGISTGSAACVFGGGILEIVCSFIIGIGINGLFSFVRVFPRIEKLIVFIAAFYAFVIASVFNSLFIGFNKEVATICGLILLIPGFSFTVAITEMVNNHLISGLSKFTHSFVIFVMLALGIGVADKVMHVMLITTPKISAFILPSWSIAIALIGVPVGFIVLLKAKRSDALWISFACWLSYIMFSFTSSFVDAPIAVFISSILLGFASNLFAKIKKRNSAIMLVPGMILLVPGSLGFFSISNLLQSNIVEGIEIALKMLTTSMALVMGIIVSDVLLKSGND